MRANTDRDPAKCGPLSTDSPAARHRPAHGGYPGEVPTDPPRCDECGRRLLCDPFAGKPNGARGYCIGVMYCLVREPIR